MKRQLKWAIFETKKIIEKKKNKKGILKDKISFKKVVIDFKIIDFEYCKICKIGVGITHYPEGDFRHQCEKLIEGMCDDCFEKYGKRKNERKNI